MNDTVGKMRRTSRQRQSNNLSNRARRISSVTFIDDASRASIVAKIEGEKRAREARLKFDTDDAKRSHLTSLAVFVFQRSYAQSAFGRWKKVMDDERRQEHEAYLEVLMNDTRKALQSSKNRTNINRTPQEIEKLTEWATVVQKDTFLHMEKDAVRDTMKSVIYRQFSDGEWPVVQGDPGLHFCILFSGTLALCAGAPSSSIAALKKDRLMALKNATIHNGYFGKVVFRMNTGASFGEVALQMENGIRTASIAAVGNCEMLLIPKTTYMKNIHAKGTEVFQTTQKLAMLPHFPFFKDWHRNKIIQINPHIRYGFIPFGKQFVTQGSKSPACYFIASGTVQITKHLEQSHQRNDKSVQLHSGLMKQSRGPRKYSVHVGTLSRHDTVGLEMLLYPEQKSEYTFTVSSSSCAVFQLDREQAVHFHAAVRTPEARKRFLDGYTRYMEDWAERFKNNKVVLGDKSDQRIDEPKPIRMVTRNPNSPPVLLSSCARIQPKPYAPSMQKRIATAPTETLGLQHAIARHELADLCQNGKGLTWHPSDGISSVPKPIQPIAPTEAVRGATNCSMTSSVRAQPYALRRRRLAKNKCRNIFQTQYDRTIDDRGSTFTHKF